MERARTPAKPFDNTYAWAMPGFNGRSYDISADGRHFLAIKQAGKRTATPTNLIVVENWFEEVKQRMPPERSNSFAIDSLGSNPLFNS